MHECFFFRCQFLSLSPGQLLANNYYAISSLTIMDGKFGLAGILFIALIILYKQVRQMISCCCISFGPLARSDASMSDIVPELPDDILLEILGRLPVSSIFQFRSASRSCRSLVVESHTCNRLPPVLVGVFSVDVHERELYGYVSLRKGFGDSSMDYDPTQFLKESSLCWGMMDSKFGLILCKKSTYIEGIYVCNPVTRKCRQITYSGLYYHLVLAFDPSWSKHHYEVIKISQNYKYGGSYIFEIFSSKTGGWDRKFTLTDHFVDLGFHGSCFVNDMLYMFESCFDDLVAIDCADGSYKRVVLPSYNQMEMDGAICNSYGSLMYSKFYKGELRVWSFLENENGYCWHLRHEVNLKDRLEKIGFTFPFDTHPDGRNNSVRLFHLDTIVLSINRKRFFYNLESDQLRAGTFTRCALLPWSPSYHAVASL